MESTVLLQKNPGSVNLIHMEGTVLAGIFELFLCDECYIYYLRMNKISVKNIKIFQFLLIFAVVCDVFRVCLCDHTYSYRT